MMLDSISALRAHAINNTLFGFKSLRGAMDQLGFVQADPIRSPAPAQDLILRHRVNNYRVGNLDQKFESLGLEEDFFYAYGFMPEKTWHLLHPRDRGPMTDLQSQVFDYVQKNGALHPRDLELHFGSEREVNAWGGYSKATTRALENLHRRGLLRVTRRERGIRIYECAKQKRDETSDEHRANELVLLIVSIFEPIPLKQLFKLPFSKPESIKTQDVVNKLLKQGALICHSVEGVDYITRSLNTKPREAPNMVRILAPFDPLVWDRPRFSLLWDWDYRFEAYTPVAKRIRGYYAMPILWRDDVVGWANVSVQNDKLEVEVGYEKKFNRSAEYKLELKNEISRLEHFLKLLD
ncbi:MAG TPA: crosslink repair DNA glycosylase YcaQ family protein [Drouetiella sp.]